MKSRIVNSTVFLFAAYFLIHFLNLVVQYLVLNLFNAKKLAMYFFYNFYTTPSNIWWNKVKVFYIYGSGIAFTFIFLILAIIIYIKLSRYKYKLNVFYNWLIIVAASYILGAVISAPFFKFSSSIYIILLWLNFEDGGGGMYLLAILCLPFLPLVGYYVKDGFLKMTNTTLDVKTKAKRVNFVFKMALVPFLLLVLLVFSLVYVAYSYPLLNFLSNEGVRFLAMGVILLFAIFFTNNRKYISIQKSNTTNQVNFSLVLLILVAIATLFVILWLNQS